MNSLKKSLPQNKAKKAASYSPGRLALGISLVAIGLLIFLQKDKPRILLSESFEGEPVYFENPANIEENGGDVPKKIIIPSVGIDIPVERSKIINGYWEVFSDKAGWGEGSGLPGFAGNQVIFAHAREGLFLPLQQIKVSQKVYVATENDLFEYEVKEIKEVYPGETEVIAKTEDETLTLYTCSGFADSKRLIIVAKRV